MELFAFDKAYVERLRDGDPPTERHFVAYFEQLLRIKLRARMMAPDKVEDLRQETLIRVIAAVLITAPSILDFLWLCSSTASHQYTGLRVNIAPERQRHFLACIGETNADQPENHQ